MQTSSPDHLKADVKSYWNRQSCETEYAQARKFSREYFEQIEQFRYASQPFIHAFAQFTRYHGKRVLEVGFGAGTDFIQWLRAGALASGIDLTEEALANLSHRIEVYGLPKPERIQVADAENLPFESNTFDLGYSWGVLHHTPDTEKSIRELARVLRPGGEMKIMLYNRHSLSALHTWAKFALLKGRPWKSVRWVLWHHQESPGTKAYTRREIVRMLAAAGLTDIRLEAVMMNTAPTIQRAPALLRPLYRLEFALANSCNWGWSWMISARKPPAAAGLQQGR
ncbi:MAG TPA: methyltransferase domain-containing protein [Candidatus Acidoferrum sp.]|nr:methyltransferase domain-containing protein [Candidatus Acidoferrum sp.]